MPKHDRFESDLGDHASFEDVKNDIATLRADMSDLISGLAESGVEIARTGANSASGAVSKAAKATREHAEEAHEQVREKVSSYPVTSLAIAFGVGAVVGRLMSRR